MKIDISGVKKWLITAVSELGKDVYSLRAAWTHIYLALYVVIALRVAFHNPASMQTLITVTGGVVSVLFTNYVLSRKTPSQPIVPANGGSNDSDN